MAWWGLNRTIVSLWSHCCFARKRILENYVPLHIFFFLNLFYLFLPVLGLHCCARAFSVQWILLLWSTGSKHAGLVAARHVESSPTRARTCAPCTGRQILNHCTTREVPLHIFKLTSKTFHFKLKK